MKRIAGHGACKAEALRLEGKDGGSLFQVTLLA